MEIINPTLAIGLIVPLVGILGAFAVQRFISFRHAAAKFRESFDSGHDINILNSYTIGKFKEVFAIHKEASRIFSGSITGCKRKRFNKIWKEYEQWANKIFTESSPKRAGVYALTLAHEGRNFTQEFKHHIDSLLKFAKQT